MQCNHIKSRLLQYTHNKGWATGCRLCIQSLINILLDWLMHYMSFISDNRYHEVGLNNQWIKQYSCYMFIIASLYILSKLDKNNRVVKQGLYFKSLGVFPTVWFLTCYDIAVFDVNSNLQLLWNTYRSSKPNAIEVYIQNIICRYPQGGLYQRKYISRNSETPSYIKKKFIIITDDTDLFCNGLL